MIFGRNVTLSFFAIVAVSFAVISAMAWQLRQTQKVVHRNSGLIAQQDETRRQLIRGFKRADVITCRSGESVKAVLHQEHAEKLRDSERFLRDHPDGIPGISVELIRSGLALERRIVRQTARRNCGELPP